MLLPPASSSIQLDRNRNPASKRLETSKVDNEATRNINPCCCLLRASWLPRSAQLDAGGEIHAPLPPSLVLLWLSYLRLAFLATALGRPGKQRLVWASRWIRCLPYPSAVSPVSLSFPVTAAAAAIAGPEIPKVETRRKSTHQHWAQTHQVSATLRSLTRISVLCSSDSGLQSPAESCLSALEISVLKLLHSAPRTSSALGERTRCTAARLLRLETIRVHAQAHGTARFPPVKASLVKRTV